MTVSAVADVAKSAKAVAPAATDFKLNMFFLP